LNTSKEPYDTHEEHHHFNLHTNLYQYGDSNCEALQLFVLLRGDSNCELLQLFVLHRQIIGIIPKLLDNMSFSFKLKKIKWEKLNDFEQCVSVMILRMGIE